MLEKDKDDHRCVECRWCVLRIDLDSGSHYWCRRSRLPLDWAVSAKKACEGFRTPEPHPAWGP